MDERYYDMVLTELRVKGSSRGLLAKAFAETGGNERAAEARYLKLRAAQIMKEDQRIARRARRARRRKVAVAASLMLVIGVAVGVIAQVGI